MEDKVNELEKILINFPATKEIKKMLMDLLESEKAGKEQIEKLTKQNEELKAELKEWDRVKTAICNYPSLTIGSNIPKKAAEILDFAIKQFKLV